MIRFPALVVAAILLAALVGASSAGVMVTDSRITPDVLAPGSEGLLTVTIANSGGGSLPGANGSTGDPVVESVRLHSTDLTVISGDYQGIGSLAPGVGVPLIFHVRAPSAPGIYFPEIWIRTEQGQTLRYPVVVNVGTQIGQLTKPAIALEKSVPEAVSPGDPFTCQPLGGQLRERHGDRHTADGQRYGAVPRAHRARHGLHRPARARRVAPDRPLVHDRPEGPARPPDNRRDP